MVEKRYQIIFAGEISDDISRKQARDQLGRLFKNSPRPLPDFFTGQPHVLKSCPDLATAENYRNQLAKLGLICAVEEVSAEAQPVSGPVLEKERIICPNCQTQQEKKAECLKCGLIFKKWQERPEGFYDEGHRDRTSGQFSATGPTYGNGPEHPPQKSFDELGKLAVLVPLLAILAFLIYKTYGWDHLHYPPGALVTTNPQEVKLWDTKSFKRDGVSYMSSEEYRVRARLIRKDGFILDLFRLGGLTVHLGWGPMSDESVLKMADITPDSIQFNQYPPVPLKLLMTCIQKYEIIPADDDVERFFRQLKIGEVVELEGYLLAGGT